jgi:hypothetical protein
MKVAFIVQRYGTEILGGSEYHCRLIAERLAPRHHVEVLTTCAQDYVSWKNEYPEGTDRVRGVTVRRFANARTRDIEAFNRYSEWIFTHAHTRRGRDRVAATAGPLVPGAARVPRAPPPPVRRPGLLHLPVRADGARHEDRAAQEHPRADRARRAGDPSRHLPRAARPAGGHRVQHRRGAAVPHDALLHPRDRRGDRRLRRGPAADAGPSATGRRLGDAHPNPNRPRPGRPPTVRTWPEPRHGLPTAPPAPRPDLPVRRPDRSGEGVRGAHRVLRQLREGGRATRRSCSWAPS